MTEEQDEFAVPRFCPKGCGETIIATPITAAEWERLKDDARTFDCTYEDSWHIKCTKCGFQSHVMSRKGKPDEFKR